MDPFPGVPEDGQDPPEETPLLTTDDLIVELVAASVIGDPRARGGYLDIRVQNGVVMLHGEVDSAESRSAIRAVTWSVPGVRDVCNQLTITPPADGRNNPP